MKGVYTIMWGTLLNNIFKGVYTIMWGTLLNNIWKVFIQ